MRPVMSVRRRLVVGAAVAALVVPLWAGQSQAVARAPVRRGRAYGASGRPARTVPDSDPGAGRPDRPCAQPGDRGGDRLSRDTGAGCVGRDDQPDCGLTLRLGLPHRISHRWGSAHNVEPQLHGRAHHGRRGPGQAGVDHQITVYNGSSGTVRIVVDRQGYVVAGTPTDAGAVTAVAPARIADTGSGSSVVRESGDRAGDRARKGGVPASGVDAVVLNVTAATPTRAGYDGLSRWRIPAGHLDRELPGRRQRGQSGGRPGGSRQAGEHLQRISRGGPGGRRR